MIAKTTFKKIIFPIILFLWGQSFTFAEESDSVLQFLKISPSPAAVGLGNAYMSIVGNADSMYYNPALSSFIGSEIKPSVSNNPNSYSSDYRYKQPLIKNINVSLSYIKYIQSLHYGSLFGAFLVKDIGTIGIGVISLFYDDIIASNIDEHGNYSTENKKISVGDYCFLLNYGYKINKEIGVGINLKGILEQLDEYKKFNFAGDAGVLYKSERWGIGFAVQNIVSTVIKFEEEQDNLPLYFKLGGHYNLNIKKLLISPKDKTLVTGKVEKGMESEFIAGAGIEYCWARMVFIRIGYQLNGNDDGIKLGAGIMYNRFQINYAFNSYENLDMVHRIGVSGNFEIKGTHVSVLKEEKKAKAKKEKEGKEESIQELIEKLPNEKEREKARDLYFFGLDRYYKEDKKGAVKLWKQIKTKNKKLQKLIKEKIKKVKKEL